MWKRPLHWGRFKSQLCSCSSRVTFCFLVLSGRTHIVAFVFFPCEAFTVTSLRLDWHVASLVFRVFGNLFGWPSRIFGGLSSRRFSSKCFLRDFSRWPCTLLQIWEVNISATIILFQCLLHASTFCKYAHKTRFQRRNAWLNCTVVVFWSRLQYYTNMQSACAPLNFHLLETIE